MKPNSALHSFLLGYALLATCTAFAADGIWNKTTAGPFNWGDTANWSGGTIADGADFTAYFTANITATQAVTLDSARAIGNISFHDATTTSNNLTISGTEILTLDRTVGIPFIDVTQTGRTLTINNPISGSDGLRKDGIGILTLGGSNNYTSGTTITGGSLNLANTGSISGALTFGATGTFNSTRIASGSLTLDALTASKGDGTVTSTAAAAANAATLTFGSLAARGAGATANFTLATNATSTGATPNKIVFTDTTNVPLADSGSNNTGFFFGSTNYARYDAAGYIRATTYGTDSNANATLSGTAVTTLGTIDAAKDVQFTGAAAATSTANGAQSAVTNLLVADGTAFKVGQAISGTNITANTYITAITGNTLTLNQATGSVAASAVITPYNLVSAQTTGDVNTLKLASNGASLRLDAAQTLGVNGILRSGGTTNIISVISGGTGIQSASSGGEMVVFTNAAADVLRIATPILANGASSLTKSGAGTLLITGANSYTGVTTLNDGTLTNLGSSTSTSGWVLNGGTLNNANANNTGTGPITVNGNAFFTPVRTDNGGGLATYTFANSLTVNSGASVSLTNGNQFTSMVLNGVLGGSGTVIMNTGAGGATGFLTLANTGNTFTGAIQINSTGNGNGLVTVGSLQDAPTNIRFSTLGGVNAGQLTLGTGASAPLLFDQRRIEFYGTLGGIIENSNTASSNANTITINTGLLVTAVGSKTLTLQGANTGNNAFSGIIANGSVAAANDAVISITKAGTGNWKLGNANNTFSGPITLNTTTTAAGTLSYASAAGTNAITFNQTTGTATFSYVGTAPITMSGLISATALTTGTITLTASGVTSADTVNYSNTSSLTSVATSNTVRKLILAGTNTGNNTFAGAFTNNTGTTNAATLTKAGVGKWVLTGGNAHTGATTLNNGTLALGANNVLPDLSNVSIGPATLDAATFTDTVGTLDVTAAATINLGSGAALAFAGGTATWAGTLNLTGTFVPGNLGSLRFGTTDTGLTDTQLLAITATGWSAFDLDVNGYLTATPDGGGAPEIDVNQGGDIASGGSKAFGTVTLGSNTSLVFTITNTGTAALNLTGSPDLVAVTGANPGDFIVTAVPTSPVTSGGGTTTFTVRFAPGAAGPRNAVLTIANNDGNEGTFTINVSGTGQTQYDAWSGGAAFDADSNNDGVKNGLAWLLGAANKDASATGLLPLVSESAGKLVMTFDCLSTANRGTALLNLQYSKDLGLTDLWSSHTALVPGAAPVSTIVNTVTFNTSANGALIHVVAEIPASAASPGTKLFGRLNAVTIP